MIKPIVKKDSFLTLHYRIGLPEGADIVNTFTDKPATLLMGGGQFAPTLENALLGMEEGNQQTFTLDAEVAFGVRNPELVQKVSLQTLEANSDPEETYLPGDIVEFNAPEGGTYAGTLQSLDKDGAWFDFNHPLSGKTITFEAKIISVL
ncbi:MAG: peptidylprolyl isomerase [Betaproteobacteria bacterium]|jgi:FKBP-type peptidyl-prolyl cis-trans isomerase SlpA